MASSELLVLMPLVAAWGAQVLFASPTEQGKREEERGMEFHQVIVNQNQEELLHRSYSVSAHRATWCLRKGHGTLGVK